MPASVADADQQLMDLRAQMTPVGQQQADALNPPPSRESYDRAMRALETVPETAASRATPLQPDPTRPAAAPQSTLPPSALPPAAMAAKQAWEAQNPSLTAPWEAVSRPTLDAERQAAAAAEQQRLADINAEAQRERVPAAQAELAKDKRDPVRAEQEAAARRAIVEAAQARNLDNFKRGVGYGTQNPNGVTDEQREAYWRGQAAKGDKYAIGQVQAIDARRAESLRREELKASVDAARFRGVKPLNELDKARLDKLKAETDAILKGPSGKPDDLSDRAELERLQSIAEQAQAELADVIKYGVPTEDGPQMSRYRDAMTKAEKAAKAWEDGLTAVRNRRKEIRSPANSPEPSGSTNPFGMPRIPIGSPQPMSPAEVGAMIANPSAAGDGVLPGLSLPPASVAGTGTPPPTTGGKGGRNPAPEGTPVRMRDGRLAHKVNGQWVYKDTGEAVKQ
jgi:hypothetical protein